MFATLVRKAEDHRQRPARLRSLRHAGVVFATVLSVAACGGDDPVAPVPPPPPPPPDDHSTLNPPGASANLDARTSMTRPGSDTAQMFDDFVFSSGTTIRSLEWQGIYCREVANAAAPVPNVISFDVSFHADQSGEPAPNPIQTQTVPLAQVNETFDQNQVLNCGQTTTTWGFYNYSATLSTPFVANAGVKYWVSVLANMPSTDLFWGWRNGTVDNNLSLQLFLGTFTSFNLDRAYQLLP